MLLTLRLKNLAIIDNLELNLAPGLSVISGETGAGKSLLVGALGLLLGAKAGPELVRSGEDEAEVEALFDTAGCELPEGLDLGGAQEVLVRRTLAAKGRSRAWLNLRPCPAAVAAEVCARLVTICGQHEHQGLLDASRHLDILDHYGGLLPQRQAVAAAWRALTEAKRGLEAEREAVGGHKGRRELLRFQVAEIEGAALAEGEEEDLEAERCVLRSAEKLALGAAEAYQALYGDDDAAVTRLGTARRRVAELAALDPRLAEVAGGLEAALAEATEAAGRLSDYLQRARPNPVRLEDIEERLALIRRLKRKFGAASIIELLAWHERAVAELAAAGEATERLAALEADLAGRHSECCRLSAALSQARSEAGVRLSAALTSELRQVAMPQAEVAVRLTPLPAAPEEGPLSCEGRRLTPRGLEEAALLVAPNPGEGLKELSRIASGGELSRVVLGLKTILSAGAETLVFDEVDAGLGGAVAEVMGRKLKRLSERQQVICITHLPQIACFADAHFRVAKEVEGGRTLARVSALSEGERLEELARMLGGVKISEQARRHAQDMMNGARSSA